MTLARYDIYKFANQKKSKPCQEMGTPTNNQGGISLIGQCR